MTCIHSIILTLTTAVLTVSTGLNQSEVCERYPTCFFNLADRSHSVSLGVIQEKNYLVPDIHSDDSCQDPVNLRVRTFDGTCNHPKNLGAFFTPMARVLPPAYSDGENSPRQFAVNGQPLPSARLVSRTVHPAVNNFVNFTIALMEWGQWIDHDLVATALGTPPNGTINCCGPNGTCPPFITNPNCFPIEVPPNDDTFPVRCLNFVRSLPAVDSNRQQIRPRAQLNSATSFLDGSQIYGSNNDVARSLRVPGGFLLRTKNGNFLPEAPNSGCIKRPKTNDYCFLAGDFRANQHAYLSSLHTIFLREHNRVANCLKGVRPRSSNEDIFQLARKIIIAFNQIITYNTWLPVILGRDASRWDLVSTTNRSFYNQGEDPRVFSSFSTAAFRFGHSIVPTVFPIGNKQVSLRTLFNRPGPVLDNIEDVLNGMIGVTSAAQRTIQATDRNFVPDISRFLFMNTTTGRGLDLVSINIQRGRDHGILPYTKWRQFCGLRPLTGFSDTAALGPNALDLQKVYRSVDDIDLYTGVVHEPADDGLLGPTGRCLVRMQFYKLKFGDRFFFDNDEPNSRLTDAQLTTLRRVTLSKIICQNSNVTRLPLNVFRFATSSNPLTLCSQLRTDDIDWKVFA